MTTKATEDFVLLSTGRTLGEKISEFISAADYGAAAANSAAVNTTAINAAIVAATSTTGFVLVTPDIAYTEADLSIPDEVVVLVFSDSGTVTYLTKDQGTTLPVTKGGLVIKSKGNTGILLRSTDYGVAAEPFIQFIDATTGDLAAAEFKFAEMGEISDPTAPTSNKARLYVKDDGAGKTQLVVRFPTGAVQVIATEP